jgi:hypothetical protein
MRRPCTLWGETFDAVGVKAVNDYLTFEEESASPSMGYSCSVLIRDPFKGDIASPVYKNKIESYKAIAEAITTIANALNAPVLATEEVLAGLPKDAKAFVVLSTGNMCKMTWAKDCWEIRDGDYYMEVEPEDSFRIIADKDDPKTAEYLRQFTLDGVRIKEKETSHD